METIPDDILRRIGALLDCTDNVRVAQACMCSSKCLRVLAIAILSSPRTMSCLLKSISLSSSLIRVGLTHPKVRMLVQAVTHEWGSISEMVDFAHRLEKRMFLQIFTDDRGLEWWCRQFMAEEEAVEGTPDHMHSAIRETWQKSTNMVEHVDPYRQCRPKDVFDQ
jgi:hypothetical protein